VDESVNEYVMFMFWTNCGTLIIQPWRLWWLPRRGPQQCQSSIYTTNVYAACSSSCISATGWPTALNILFGKVKWSYYDMWYSLSNVGCGLLSINFVPIWNIQLLSQNSSLTAWYHTAIPPSITSTHPRVDSILTELIPTTTAIAGHGPRCCTIAAHLSIGELQYKACKFTINVTSPVC